MKPLATLFLFVSWLFLYALADSVQAASSITGTLDSVMDGDLITIISRGKEIEVRLYGVDAPEKTQPYGQSAKNLTGALASGKEIRAEPMSKDPNGRIVAIVFAGDINLNEQIISQGFGWVERQECKERFCADWLRLELHAKAARKGLWTDENPTPPWEHRQKRAVAQANQEFAATASASAGPKGSPTGPAAYHGDTRTRVFHSAACKEFNCRTCTAKFHTISEALDAGYRPHADCVTK